MSSTAELHRRAGSTWIRGFVPVARREIHRLLRTRRGAIQLVLWSGLLGGVLALALFVLPNTMTEEGPLSLPEILEMGRQLFFGIGAIGLAIGTIILLQDAFIEDRAAGTAELVLSKPLSRTAYVLGRLLPNLLGFLITMLVILAIITATGLPLPESGVTMLASTLIWIVVFVAVAVTRMNRAEL